MVHVDGDRWKWDFFDRAKFNRGRTFRTPFQRDLDNLTFSGAFRRLQGKTQVRRTGPECFSRTRLSHSIEVSRIARSIVTHLHLKLQKDIGTFIDSDLVEFACFAHDIGNPPFGHAGERELNKQMQEHGGFEGNAQSLRIITKTAWVTGGIGPTKAAVDSILKYKEFWNTKRRKTKQPTKFLYDDQTSLLNFLALSRTPPCIECQIMDLADDIGNALIDFSDGQRARIITPEKVKEWGNRQPDDKSDYAVYNILKAFREDAMTKFARVRAYDCIESIRIVDSPSREPRYCWKIELSDRYRNFVKALQLMNAEFLFKHASIRGTDQEGAFILRTLFEIFWTHYINKESGVLADYNVVPKDWHARFLEAEEHERYGLICDYLAGMTDDYAKIKFDRAIEVAL